jgi:hypothetical protein
MRPKEKERVNYNNNNNKCFKKKKIFNATKFHDTKRKMTGMIDCLLRSE